LPIILAFRNMFSRCKGHLDEVNGKSPVLASNYSALLLNSFLRSQLFTNNRKLIDRNAC